MDRWQVGDIRVTRILEQVARLETAEEFFPDASEEALRPHLSWLMPRAICPQTGRLIMPVQGYLVQTARHLILVDACVGNAKRCGYLAEWNMRDDNAFLERMSQAGAHPEAIDFVLCTHLHVDHCGWNTRLVNGRWAPTFPNARYVIARREYEAARALAGAYPGDFTYEENVLPIVEAGRADFVEMDHAIDNQVWLEPTPGHTDGHVAIRLSSRGETAVIAGDLMHSPIQCVYPDWSYRFDADPALARRTRRAFLEGASEHEHLVLTAHFPLPSVGKITRRGAGFWFSEAIQGA
jgi:glyoxylase-like metal-dependent hydrolase (beta-lactamase superfamily II)